VSQQETKFEHGQQPFDDPFDLDCSRAARLPTSRLDSRGIGAGVPFHTPGVSRRGRGALCWKGTRSGQDRFRSRPRNANPVK
jgi:hypothetical protein